MNSNSKKITLVSASIMAIFMAGSAQAIVGKSVSEEIVSFSDLNLSKVEGQKTLQRRLEATAKKVCSVDQAFNTRSVSRIADSKRCYKESIELAMKKVSLAKQ